MPVAVGVGVVVWPVKVAATGVVVTAAPVFTMKTKAPGSLS